MIWATLPSGGAAAEKGGPFGRRVAIRTALKVPDAGRSPVNASIQGLFREKDVPGSPGGVRGRGRIRIEAKARNKSGRRGGGKVIVPFRLVKGVPRLWTAFLIQVDSFVNQNLLPAT